MSVQSVVSLSVSFLQSTTVQVSGDAAAAATARVNVQSAGQVVDGLAALPGAYPVGWCPARGSVAPQGEDP